MSKDSAYYLVKTRALEKSKATAEKSAKESQEKVDVLYDAFRSVEETKKLRQKAERHTGDLAFLLSDLKGPKSAVVNKAYDLAGKTTENKKEQERLKDEQIDAQERFQAVYEAQKDAEKKLNALFRSPDEADRKWVEQNLRTKAAEDSVKATDIARKLGRKEVKLATVILADEKAKLNVAVKALEDNFVKLIPNGDAQLQALETAEKDVDDKLQQANGKQQALLELESLARGDDEAAAKKVLDDAEVKLKAAEKALADSAGNAKTKAELTATRDALQATRDKAKDEHLLFEQATSGKYRVLDKQVQELTDLLQANQAALATAGADQKAALKKKGAEYEAKLAKLALFKKQTGKINLLGVPTAISSHVEAQGKVKEAREKLITARATVTRLENSIPVPKEVLKGIGIFNESIKSCQTKVDAQEIAVANLQKALAGSMDDADKQEIQTKLSAAESKLKKEQQELQRNIVGLNDYRATKRQQLEEALFDPQKTALITARKEEQKADAALGAATKLVATQKQEIEDRIANVTKIARAELDDAQLELDAAEKDLAKQNLEYEQAIAGQPELKKASEEMEAATKKTQEAAEAEKKALDNYAAAEQEAVAAEVIQQALKDREQEARAFAPFKHLKDADFEKALRKGNDETALNLFPEKPAFPGNQAKADELKAYDKAQKEFEAKSAVVTENLRRAQETMERMLARDEILEAAGASLEERKRAFGDLPPALLPPKFREELQAYREVEELFKIEDEHERIKAATKEELKNSILKDLKGLAEVALPIVELFLDASCIVNNFIPVAIDPGEGATEDQKSAFETAEALKAKFEITRMVAEGLECFINTKEMLESEQEMLEAMDDSDEDEEKVILRQMKKDDKTAKMLAFMKDFIITTAKTTKGVLSMTKAGIGLAHNTGASEIAKTIGGVVPILGAVLDGIETAEAMYAAGKQIKMAYLENQIHAASKKMQDEEALIKAYGNQSNRATNRAVKKSIHATAKAVQTTGSAVIASGVASGAGAGVYAAGKAAEYGNKATFKAIDWAMAAQAQKTLEMARAGSYEAMTEIFADHQKYATMYIVMKAVKGDVKAQAFCATRSLDMKHLDSSTSLALLSKELKVARQEMLRKVEQTDEARTIQDSAGETFDKLARGGKAIAKLADMATLGTGSKVIDLVKEKADELRGKQDEVVAVPEPEINEIKPLNSAGFLALKTRAQTILEKFNDHLSITEKDVQWRARWLKHLKDLMASLDGDGDWTDAAFKNEGGTIARRKINDAWGILQKLPDKPTMEAANGRV